MGSSPAGCLGAGANPGDGAVSYRLRVLGDHWPLLWLAALSTRSQPAEGAR